MVFGAGLGIRPASGAFAASLPPAPPVPSRSVPASLSRRRPLPRLPCAFRLIGVAILAVPLPNPLFAAPATEIAASAPASASPSASEVDTTIVLRAGAVDVSRYALEKQHHQFVAQTTQEGRPPPDLATTARWLDVFHARQLVTAHALTLGYGTHPEVLRIVDTMERHMLSQSEGPYYHSLYAGPPAPDAREFDRHLAASRRELDLVTLSFPAAARDTLLGSAWETATDAERLARLAALGATAAAPAPDAQYFDGWSAWPYPPVDHATTTLVSTRVGAWLETSVDAFPEPRVAVIHVRAERLQPPPKDEAAARQSFARSFEQHRKRQIRQTHRARTLRAARFAFDPESADGLLAALAALPPGTIELPPTALSPRPDAPLCHYEDETGGRTVSVAAWAEAFNRLFLRKIPADLAALTRGAEDLVLARLDEAEARRLGLDRTPRFMEDRRNFHYAQVLDLFERERLAPGIDLSDGTVAAYHSAHAAEFAPIPSATVRRLRFAKEETAAEWTRLAAVGTAHREGNEAPAPPAPLEETMVEISARRPLPDAPQVTFFLLNAREGERVGPLRVGSDHLVFVKASPTRQAVPTLAELEAEIRRRLTREALDARLLALARELAPTIPCEDHIPYQRFGLPDPLPPSAQ